MAATLNRHQAASVPGSVREVAIQKISFVAAKCIIAKSPGKMVIMSKFGCRTARLVPNLSMQTVLATVLHNAIRFLAKIQK